MFPKHPVFRTITFAIVVFVIGCTSKDVGARAAAFNPLGFLSGDPMVERDISSTTPDGTPLDCRTE